MYNPRLILVYTFSEKFGQTLILVYNPDPNTKRWN